MSKSETIKYLAEWIKWVVHFAKSDGVVVGLSGGIDSSVVAALCNIGLENVLGVIIPIESDISDEQDAIAVAEMLEISYVVKPLANVYYPICKMIPYDQLVCANVKARLRMTLLYAIASSKNYLVAGTGNRSELMTGYCTKYGDGGVDFEPLGNLYKTEVRKIAKVLKIPNNIITKPPSAGLWEGQTDEEELGMSYEELDKCLMCYDSDTYPDVFPKSYGRASELIEGSVHKRQMPPIPERREL